MHHRPDDFIDGFGPCAAFAFLVYLLIKGAVATVRRAHEDRKAIKESRARLRELAREKTYEDGETVEDILYHLNLSVATTDWKALCDGGYVQEWAR